MLTTFFGNKAARVRLYLGQFLGIPSNRTRRGGESRPDSTLSFDLGLVNSKRPDFIDEACGFLIVYPTVNSSYE